MNLHAGFFLLLLCKFAAQPSPHGKRVDDGNHSGSHANIHSNSGHFISHLEVSHKTYNSNHSCDYSNCNHLQIFLFRCTDLLAQKSLLFPAGRRIDFCLLLCNLTFPVPELI